MIYIICGENNQGKTKKIRSLYSHNKTGDGFITQKIFNTSAFVGYEIQRLSTGKTCRQSHKREFFPQGINPFLSCGSFNFYEEGFAFADSIIEDIINRNIDPVFIDEIGPIELMGKGHYSCFSKILKKNKTLYFTVRNECLEEVLDFFSIRSYTLIRL